jgi:hypothetical protein
MVIWEMAKSLGQGLWSHIVNRRKLKVLVHRARFDPGPAGDYYFVNVTNMSKDREVEITHVWFETDPQVHVMQPDRPLPKRLKPDEPWETWIPVGELPIKCDEQVFKLGRVRMSNDAVAKSKKRRYVPSRGFTPGGPVKPTDRGDVDAIIRYLLPTAHSFQWLRDNTECDYTDKEFIRIVHEHPDWFKLITIVKKDYDGKASPKGLPGMKLTRKARRWLKKP